MKMIALAIGSAAVATVIIEYQFLMISNDSFPSEEDLARFFGLFYALTGAVSLVTQLFLTGWILTQFGILAGMLLLPTGLSLGSMAILFSPILASALIARTSDQVTKFTINKTSVELLWVPIAPEQKQSAKLFIDGTIKTGLQGLTGLIIFIFLKFLELPTPTVMKYLSIIALGSTIIWVATAFRLKKGYVSALMSAIEKRRLDFEQLRLDTTDSDIISTMERTLNSDEEAQQIFALELIEDLYLTPWRKTLNRLFQNGSPLVQQKILSMAGESPEVISNAELLAVIEAQGPLAEEALVIAGKRRMTEIIPLLTNYLEGPDTEPPRIRAAAATAILLMDAGPQSLAQSTFDKMLTPGDEALNAIALKMLIYVPSVLSDASLCAFLFSDSAPISDAALEIAQNKDNPELIPAIVDNLKHPHTAVLARRVLKRYPGDKVVQVLNEICCQPETARALKLEIIPTLKEYPMHSVIHYLISFLDRDDPQLYAEVVDAVLGIARQEPLPPNVLIPIVDSNAPVCRNQTGVSTAFLWFMNVKTPRVNQLSPSKPKTRSTFSQKGLSTSVISDSIEVNVSKTLFPI